MMLRRGEIYYADLGKIIGSEQGGKRPVLIVQNDIGNFYSPTTIILPITSAYKKPLPTHADIVTSNEKYQEQSAELQTKIAKLQKELSRLTHADDEDDVLEQISELINYFENHPDKMTEFDENAFNCIVEKIIVHTENELEFHLIGDFHFKEFI